jgi:putative heme iron utilization protein
MVFLAACAMVVVLLILPTTITPTLAWMTTTTTTHTPFTSCSSSSSSSSSSSCRGPYRPVPSFHTTTTILYSNSAPRHDVGASAQMELSPVEQAKMEAYSLHQQTAPKLDWATDVRTLVQYNHGFAVLSTHSKSDPDYPGGSVVGFAPDHDGRPLFIFSGMSTHTQDILLNPHVSLTVAAKDFKGAADGRVNLMGRVELIRNSDEKEAAKAIYLQKHPNAFWVNFGDFNWFRMTVDKVRFVGGFARAGTCTAEEYLEAKPDPIAEFGPNIAQHMNDDHMAATIAMVHASVPGMEEDPENAITDAMITSVDSLGMYIKVTREKPVKYLPQQFKLRLPFPRSAADRKDVKTMIMELTQKASTKA